MAIKKFFATKDNTITDGYGSIKSTRATGANMGASDVLEVYSLYGSFTTSSLEKSRLLVQFDTTDIAAKRTAGDIPASGSTNFFLKLTNTPHQGTQATDFTLTINAISRSWDEGIGLDMDEYLDTGVSNWKTASYDGSTYTAWTSEGGDYHTSPESTATFTTGIEDLDVDVTDIVEQWLAGTKSNYGFFVKLSSSYESGATNTIPSSSYYTKKFFARGSEFFYKRPIIEARWDDSKRDDRSNFYLSSSLLLGEDNLNTLYLYNIVNGKLKNIPVLGGASGSNNAYTQINVQVFPSGNVKNQVIKPKTLPIGGGVTVNAATVITGGWVSTGIYSASFAFTGSESEIFDVWSKPTKVVQGIQLVTGSTFKVNKHKTYDYNPSTTYITTLKNLKSSYSQSDKVRIRLFVRPKDWQPNIYTVASKKAEPSIIKDAYYRVFRLIDQFDVIPFGTGSGAQSKYTRMSYDKNGNYFDLEMSLFESDYAYGIQLAYDTDGKHTVQDKIFKFRVEK